MTTLDVTVLLFVALLGALLFGLFEQGGTLAWRNPFALVRDRFPRARLAAIGVLAASPMLMAGSCATLTGDGMNGLQVAAGVSRTLSGAAPDITTDIGLACQAGEGLLKVAAGFPSKRVATHAATLDASLTKFCNKVPASSAQLRSWLATINFAGAVLLGDHVAGP